MTGAASVTSHDNGRPLLDMAPSQPAVFHPLADHSEFRLVEQYVLQLELPLFPVVNKLSADCPSKLVTLNQRLLLSSSKCITGVVFTVQVLPFQVYVVVPADLTYPPDWVCPFERRSIFNS